MSLASFFTLYIILCSLSFIAQGLVPSSETFNFVNEGDFLPYIVEYNANYRTPFYQVLSNSPFLLCFYNTTPGAYTLALRMGAPLETVLRWVWEANRGNPVGENATFSLGTNGNLVLAEANGRVAWQSNTANKNVVGFKLLPNGNMVLHDSKGNFVWQSFDSPTDTLLVGQSLRRKGPNKLVSRLSEKDNKNGPYSMVLEPKRFALYYKSKNSPTRMLYLDAPIYPFADNHTIDVLTFTSDPETDDAFAYDLKFVTPDGYNRFLSRPKYNSTLTYLRLGIDGGLRAFTFYAPVNSQSWEETFTLFPRDSGEECQIPDRCGNYGLCEDSQCVACPSPNGLLGWSRSCAPPKIISCKDVVKYYRIEGVDHFLSKYTSGTGPIKEADCQKKCTSDCKCAGFFFNRAESRCLVVYDLKTLIKVDNSTHVGFIKTA